MMQYYYHELSSFEPIGNTPENIPQSMFYEKIVLLFSTKSFHNLKPSVSTAEFFCLFFFSIYHSYKKQLFIVRACFLKDRAGV